MAKSKDLFDDTTMSFGEHLEALRGHVWKAIIGLVVCVCLSLIFGKSIVGFVRIPIDAALERHSMSVVDDLSGFTEGEPPPESDGASGGDGGADPQRPEQNGSAATADNVDDPQTIPIAIPVRDLARALHQYDPDQFPAPDAVEPSADEPRIWIKGTSPYFAQLRAALKRLDEPITLTVEEAFMTYLKVSLISGIVLASPWMFYQIWLFVAAGLYPHERKYVHLFLPLSLGLFLGGAVFCFFVVFPYVLDFLLGFNQSLGVTPQIRLSEWISFAVVLPVMFGISFQLPLVMLFLERISVFDVAAYREKRRLAIFVIAVISMFLTPADPMSMMMMMIPLVVLYEFGIQMCKFAAQREGSPFPSEAA